MSPPGNLAVRKAPGRPRLFDVELALDRATQLFWAKGFAATTIDDLTTELDVRPPSLYNAFGDKEQLFLRCVERYASTVTDGIRQELDTVDVKDAVEGFLTGAARAFASDDAPQGCLLIFGLGGAIEQLPQAKARFALAIETMVMSVERRLTKAKTDGCLVAEFPAHERAVLCTDFLLVLAVKARAGATRRSLHAEAVERSELVLR